MQQPKDSFDQVFEAPIKAVLCNVIIRSFLFGVLVTAIPFLLYIHNKG